MDNIKNKLDRMIFENTDVYRCNNYIYKYGLNKNMKEEEIIKIAKENNCNGIAKHGKGKWYLRKYTREELLDKINNNNCYYKNVRFIII